MVYFGDIGPGGQMVKDYFGRYGAPCMPGANPAEYIIDVVSGQLSQDKIWNEIWLNSPEHSRRYTELEALIANAASKEPGTIDDGNEFAMPLWA
jgi:hypothetical protein